MNESGAIAKVRLLVEGHTVKHLKAFRIISSKILIFFLSCGLVFSRCFSCLQMFSQKLLIFTFMRLKYL